jgi:O-antigen/teichoic acid export membrane protein
LTGAGVVIALAFGGGLPVMAGVTCLLALANYGGLRLLVGFYAGRNLAPVTKVPTGLIRACLQVGAPMGLMSAGTFLFSYTQVPLIGFLIGPEGVPAFYLAQRIGQLVNGAVLHLMHPQLPLFTQELASGRNTEARQRMKRTILAVSIGAVGANTAFYFLSPVLVELWVGPGRYLEVAALLTVSIDYMVLSAVVVWGSFVLASGRNPFVVPTIVSGSLNLLLCLGLVPKLGLLGVPLASLLAGLLFSYWLNPWFGWALLRRLRQASQVLL